MKTILQLVLTCCLAPSLFSQYQISQVSSAGTNGVIANLSFVNETTGFHFSGRKILKTTDSGDTWNVLVNDFNAILPTGADYISGQFITENIGWVVLRKYDNVNSVNDSSYLYKTSNGGLTWNLLHINPPNSVQYSSPGFSKCFFKDENHGWVFGWGLLQATADGGMTWNNLYLNDTNIYNNRVIRDMCMSSSSDLYTAGYGSWVMKFSNDGSDLTTQSYYNGGQFATDDYYFNGVDFMNADTGFVAVRSGYFKRTFNGGITWENMETDYIHDNNEVAIGPDNTVWMASGEHCDNTGCYHSTAILYSSDLGNSWSDLINLDNTNNHFLDIVWPSDDYGIATTIKGEIHKITPMGAGLNELEIKFEVFPNPVQDVLSVQSIDGTLQEVQLKDLNGKLLVSSVVSSMDVSSLPAGIYFVTVKTDRGVATQKVIKK